MLNAPRFNEEAIPDGKAKTNGKDFPEQGPFIPTKEALAELDRQCTDVLGLADFLVKLYDVVKKDNEAVTKAKPTEGQQKIFMTACKLNSIFMKTAPPIIREMIHRDEQVLANLGTFARMLGVVAYNEGFKEGRESLTKGDAKAN